MCKTLWLPFSVYFAYKSSSLQLQVFNQMKKLGKAPLELTEKLLSAATHVLAFLSKESKWTKVVADEANQRGIPTYVYHLDESD